MVPLIFDGKHWDKERTNPRVLLRMLGSLAQFWDWLKGALEWIKRRGLRIFEQADRAVENLNWSKTDFVKLPRTVEIC